ncbi:GvpL/GvpF family gas vesicle protein [Kitasatospora sp. NPDC001660]
MAIYVYAITADSHPLRLDGITGVGDPPEELSTISGSDLAAVVSAVPEGLRARRRDVLAHQDLLQRLRADGTVLPLRFGTLASDVQEVRDVLKERADSYRERLHSLEGCSEYLLKASCEEDALLWQILSDSEEARQLNDESRRSGDPNVKIRLGELVAGEIRARETSAATHAVDSLRPLAREVHENEAAGNDFVSASFLVEDARGEEFTAAQTRLASKWGEAYQFRLHGPLPPYSFV